MAFCQKCGSELRDGSTFCEKCGASVPNEFDSWSSYGQQSNQGYGAPSRSSVNAADRQLLRILSVLFSIALAVFFVGLGGRIYIGRVIDNEVQSDLNSKQKSIMLDLYAAIGRGDGRALLKAAQKAEQYSYEMSGRSSSYKAETITDDDVRNANQQLSIANRWAGDEFGFRWTLFRIAGYYSTVMLISGIAAGVFLLLWILKGGRPGNLSATVSPGSCIIVLGLIVLLVYAVISADFSSFAGSSLVTL